MVACYKYSQIVSNHDLQDHSGNVTFLPKSGCYPVALGNHNSIPEIEVFCNHLLRGSLFEKKDTLVCPENASITFKTVDRKEEENQFFLKALWLPGYIANLPNFRIGDKGYYSHGEIANLTGQKSSEIKWAIGGNTGPNAYYENLGGVLNRNVTIVSKERLAGWIDVYCSAKDVYFGNINGFKSYRTLSPVTLKNEGDFVICNKAFSLSIWQYLYGNVEKSMEGVMITSSAASITGNTLLKAMAVALVTIACIL